MVYEWCVVLFSFLGLWWGLGVFQRGNRVFACSGLGYLWGVWVSQVGVFVFHGGNRVRELEFYNRSLALERLRRAGIEVSVDALSPWFELCYCGERFRLLVLEREYRLVGRFGVDLCRQIDEDAPFETHGLVWVVGFIKKLDDFRVQVLYGLAELLDGLGVVVVLVGYYLEVKSLLTRFEVCGELLYGMGYLSHVKVDLNEPGAVKIVVEWFERYVLSEQT